jgi:hypothetical protein
MSKYQSVKLFLVLGRSPLPPCIGPMVHMVHMEPIVLVYLYFLHTALAACIVVTHCVLTTKYQNVNKTVSKAGEKVSTEEIHHYVILILNI